MVDWVYRLVDSARSWFTVVSWWCSCEGSSERLLLGNSGHRGSLWLRQKEEETLLVLTDNSRRRWDGWDGPATGSRGGGAWSSSMRCYERGGEKPTRGWAEAGSWCLLYRVIVQRGEAVRCRQMVTGGGGSSRRPFWLGRGNEGGGAHWWGEMKATGCRFDSATHMRRRVSVGGVRCSDAGRGGGSSGLVRGRGWPPGGMAGPKMGHELGRL
jgi:hypothetical protein